MSRQPEIWANEGKITHFIAGRYWRYNLGVGKYLKEKNPI
jgi:hypothetical protein